MKNKRMQNSNRKKVGICEAFQKKSLRTNILVLLFVWNINALAFSGCGVYLSSSSSNLNLTMFLLGTVQAVCCLISGNLFLKFKVEKLLRFTTTFISFFFLLFLFEPDHKNNLENKFSLFFTICLVMGNIGIELNWPILCTFMHKYVPRKFHQNVFSLATMRIMVFLVPYYIELMLYFSITPIFGFGLLALLSRIFLNFVKKHEEDGNGLLFELIKFELNKLEETEYANTKRWNESSED